MMDKWVENEDKCPRCGRETEFKIGQDDEGHEYHKAERCARCRWVVNFESERIEVASY